MRRRWPRARFVEDADATAPYARARLRSRAHGGRKRRCGSCSSARISRCGYGRRCCASRWARATTYSDIARHIGKPKAARAVGAAVGRNPVSFVVPCHRVLGRSRRAYRLSLGPHPQAGDPRLGSREDGRGRSSSAYRTALRRSAERVDGQSRASGAAGGGATGAARRCGRHLRRRQAACGLGACLGHEFAAVELAHALRPARRRAARSAGRAEAVHGLAGVVAANDLALGCEARPVRRRSGLRSFSVLGACAIERPVALAHALVGAARGPSRSIRTASSSAGRRGTPEAVALTRQSRLREARTPGPDCATSAAPSRISHRRSGRRECGFR